MSKKRMSNFISLIGGKEQRKVNVKPRQQRNRLKAQMEEYLNDLRPNVLANPTEVLQSTAVTHDESMKSFSDSYDKEEDADKSLFNMSTVSHVLNHIESDVEPDSDSSFDDIESLEVESNDSWSENDDAAGYWDNNDTVIDAEQQQDNASTAKKDSQ